MISRNPSRRSKVNSGLRSTLKRGGAEAHRRRTALASRLGRVKHRIFPRSSCGLLAVSLLTFTACVSQVIAQDDLSQQSQNPVANLISVPFEINTYFDVGPTEKLANVMLVKPVYPMSVGDNWNLINRAIVPLVYLEGQDAITVGSEDPELGALEVFPGGSSEFGLGNIQYQGFFSPASPGKWIWGVGPALELPTNTDDSLGTDTWSIGPAAVVLTMPGNWVVGGLAMNIWDFAGSSGEPDINKFTFQYFVNYNLPDGWYLTSAPVITADWEADSSDRWTVPVGGGVGRLMRFGKQPVDLRLAGTGTPKRRNLVRTGICNSQLSSCFRKGDGPYY